MPTTTAPAQPDHDELTSDAVALAARLLALRGQPATPENVQTLIMNVYDRQTTRS